MALRSAQDAEFDFCERCEGVFLDAKKGYVAGLEVSLFLSFSARSGGTSTRLCPDHGEAMALFIVETHAGTLTIERTPCCGGVFLDAGEATALIGGAQAAAAQAGAAQVAPPQAAARPAVGKTCPRCQAALGQATLQNIEIDECATCASIFFDAGEPEKAGIDTEALFGGGAWSAQAIGPDGACPSCHVPMQRYQAEMAMGPPVQASFAACCGGVWVARSAEQRLRAAARRAVSDRADQQFMSGDLVERTLAQRTPEELQASKAALQRHDQAMHRDRQLAAVEQERTERRNARIGGALDIASGRNSNDY